MVTASIQLVYCVPTLLTEVVLDQTNLVATREV